MRENVVSRFEQVRFHRERGPLYVFRLDRLEDLTVVVKRDAALLGRVPDVELVDERRIRDPPQRGPEQRAVSRGDDDVVEGQILLDQVADVPHVPVAKTLKAI